MPSELEFQLPLSREELLRHGDRACYVVRERLSASELNHKLDGEPGRELGEGFPCGSLQCCLFLSLLLCL